MRKASLLLEVSALAGVIVFAGLPASAADAPPDIRISRAAARVVVIPEARQDVLVQVRPGRTKLGALKVRRQGRTQVVEGDVALSLGWRPAWLGGDACDKGQLTYKGQTITAADLPVVTVRTPQYVNIESDGFVIGEVGATQRLTLTSSGCGAWRAAATAGDVRITNKGASEIVAAGGRGAVTVTLEGAGPITINGGWAAVLWASSKGTGDFTYRGDAGRVDVQLNGKGDITLGKVFGAMDARTPGDGKYIYKRR